MPFEYRVDTVVSETELEDAINQWAKKGYEPHNICMISKKSLLSGTDIPTLILIVRKVIRHSRKGRLK